MLTNGLCNWSIVAFPTAGWAQQVFGEPDVRAGLWAAVATAVRLDEPDPVSGMAGAHRATLRSGRRLLNDRRFDALRYLLEGPGTDLTIGSPSGVGGGSPPRTNRWGSSTSRTCPRSEVFHHPGHAPHRGDGAIHPTRCSCRTT